MNWLSVLWFVPLMLLAGVPSGCMNCAKGGPPPDEPCVYVQGPRQLRCDARATGVWSCDASANNPDGSWIHSGGGECRCIGEDGTFDEEACPYTY